jgi:hypothetical protein
MCLRRRLFQPAAQENLASAEADHWRLGAVFLGRLSVCCKVPPSQARITSYEAHCCGGAIASTKASDLWLRWPNSRCPCAGLWARRAAAGLIPISLPGASPGLLVIVIAASAPSSLPPLLTPYDPLRRPFRQSSTCYRRPLLALLHLLLFILFLLSFNSCLQSSFVSARPTTSPRSPTS